MRFNLSPANGPFNPPEGGPDDAYFKIPCHEVREFEEAFIACQGALGQASFCLRHLLPKDPDAQHTVQIIQKALKLPVRPDSHTYSLISGLPNAPWDTPHATREYLKVIYNSIIGGGYIVTFSSVDLAMMEELLGLPPAKAAS